MLRTQLSRGIARPVRSPIIQLQHKQHGQRRSFSEIITTASVSLQTLHEVSGIPWYALIPLATISLRLLLTTPLTILQRRRIQKQASLRPIVSAMGPILRLKLAQRAQSAKATEQLASGEMIPGTNLTKGQGGISGQAAGLTYEQIMMLSAKERRERQKKMFKEQGCEMWKNWLVPLAQVPLWVGMSMTMRELSGWNGDGVMNGDYSGAVVQGLANEGLWWCTDLSAADPMGILPIVIGTLSLTNVEWNMKTMQMGTTSVRTSQRVTAMDALMNCARLGVVFMMAVSSQVPAALGLYWCASNAFSTVQNMLLDYYLPVKYIPEGRIALKDAPADAVPLVERRQV